MEQIVSGKVTGVIRQRNSQNGNPRFRFDMEDGTHYYTYPNANFAYGITGGEVGSLVELTIGRRKQIESINIIRKA